MSGSKPTSVYLEHYIQSFQIEVGLLNEFWSVEAVSSAQNQRLVESAQIDLLKNSQIQILTLQTSLKLATLSLDFDSIHINDYKGRP